MIFKNEEETFHFQVVKRLHTWMQILPLIRVWSDLYLGLLVVAGYDKDIVAISFGQLANNKI